jgi:hypothetical protein
MEDPSLSRRVGRWRAAPVPSSPAVLESNVLQRIRAGAPRHRDPGGAGDGLFSLLDLFQPARAAAILIMAVLIGSSSAAFYHAVSRSADKPTASVALGFEPITRPVSLPTDHP